MSKCDHKNCFLMPPVKSKRWRIVSAVVLALIVAFFAVSAGHHIIQYFELAGTDLSVARNRLEAQKALGMVDAVFDVLLHDHLRDTGLYDPTSTIDVTIFELRLSLAIGLINALLALAMIFARRRKSLWLFVSALWTLGLTAALVLASPEVLGNVNGELACNCTGLEILDINNIWAELGRNGAFVIALLWLSYAWAAPAPNEPDNG